MGENMMVDPNLASTNDDVIIRIEMAELEAMAEEQDSRKRDLVLAAAEKLAEKYAGDTTVVSAKLQALLSNDRRIGDRKIYGTVSKSYISDILPPEYKRAYAVPEPRDDTPLNAMEEMLARAADLAKSIGVIMQDTLTELQDLRQSGRPGDFELYEKAIASATEIMTHEFHAKMMEDLRRQLSTIGQLGDFVAFLKNMEVEVAALRRLADKRHKFSTAAKILLRMVFTFRSYDHVASTLSDARRYGGKWLSAINRDPELSRFLKSVRCPHCKFDFEKWIEKAKLAQECGIDMPPIDSTYCEAE